MCAFYIDVHLLKRLTTSVKGTLHKNIYVYVLHNTFSTSETGEIKKYWVSNYFVLWICFIILFKAYF